MHFQSLTRFVIALSASTAVLMGMATLRPAAAAFAAPALKVGDAAPVFSVSQDDGSQFSLEARKGQGWTVLYFYPKAETPGCTAQACAFRDNIKFIREQGAEVFGVSTDTAPKLAEFRKHHNLNFPLLADPKAEVVAMYGVKMPLVDIAKRWTFVIDPQLKIRWIDNVVDPAKDAKNVADKLRELKAKG